MDLQEELLAAMERVFRQMRQHVRPLAEPRPVRGPELRILFMLRHRGPAHPSALAETMGVSRAVVSTIIRRLTDLGLVTTRVGPEDRRRHLISLTPAADELLERIHEHRRAMLRNLLGRLSPEEQQVLLNLFRKMATPP
jgi:DNA-binding MarR family transcriptional regulator